MSHSTLQDFHYPVIIQSLRTGTSAVKHLNRGILQAHKWMLHFFSDRDSRRQFAIDVPRKHKEHYIISLREVRSAGGLFSVSKAAQNEPDHCSDLICLQERVWLHWICHIYENKEGSFHS